jgi:hypothetical protein
MTSGYATPGSTDRVARPETGRRLTGRPVTLLGLVITEINPDHDPDRRHLRLLADRLAEALTGC